MGEKFAVLFSGKLSYNPRKSKRFSGPRKPEVFSGDKFYQRNNFFEKS